MLLIFILLTFSTPLAVLYSGVVLVKKPEKFKKIIWLYVLAFAFLAYSYTPTYTNDLVRYYIMIDGCKWLPFSQAFTWADDGLVVKNIWFWILSRIEEPHLLQAVTIGSLYGTTAYITCDSFRNDKKKMWVVFLIQIMFLPFHLANNNIRNIVTFALMFLAVYRDMVQKKRNFLTAILYIMPVFIHMTGLVVIALRFSVIFFKKHFKVGLLATFTVPFLVLKIYPILKDINIPGGLGKIIQRAIWKSYTNVMSNSAYAASMRDSGFVNSCRAVMFLACVLIILLTLNCLKNEKIKSSSQYEFMIFDMIFCSITCIWIMLGAVKFWVFGVAAILGSGPMFAYYFEKTNDTEKPKLKGYMKVLLFGLFMLGMARAALEFYYLSQRIVWADYLPTMMTTNIWSVVVHIVKIVVSM